MTQMNLLGPPVRGLMECCTWRDAHGLHSYGWTSHGNPWTEWTCHGCGKRWSRKWREKE